MTENENAITIAADRPEISLHLGKQTRTLRFAAQQAALLEELLDKDPLAYLGGGGGQTRFCASAILAGLSYDKGLRKEMTTNTVYRWLDEEKDLDRSELQKAVLYAIARGKTGKEAERMVRALDEAFNDTPTNEPGFSPGG